MNVFLLNELPPAPLREGGRCGAHQMGGNKGEKMKIISILLLLFVILNPMNGLDRLKMRNSTDPVEKALERALHKIFIDSPERIDIVVSEVNAFDPAMVQTIYNHIENILLDVGFTTVDRSSRKYSRDPFLSTDSKVWSFILVAKATDKQILVVAFNAETGVTYGHASEKFIE